MHSKMRLAVALAVAALLALPGEAKTVHGQAAPSPAMAPTVLVAKVEPALPQAAFGRFADPHAEPVLSIVLPTGYPAF